MLKQLLILSIIFLPALSMFAQRTESHQAPETMRKPAPEKQEKSAPGKLLKPTPEVNRTDLITVAKEYLGTPYLRGSTNPKKGFDCSGFVYFVFKKFDIALPRSSREYKSLGTELKPEEFKVGDVLVFYGYKDNTHIGHVGIICEANGMKSRFIHASSGKAYSVTISDLGSAGYKRRFYKCIDVLGTK